MRARNRIWGLVIAVSLLSSASALAQTERRLFEGATTYFLEVVTNGSCGLSEDIVKRTALFPLSYSGLKQEEGLKANIWIAVNIGAHKIRGRNECYGSVSVEAYATLWHSKIPFNEKTRYANIILWRQRENFISNETKFILDIVEDLMKTLITNVNLDNQ